MHVLALDFDGVICDSSREVFVVAPLVVLIVWIGVKPGYFDAKMMINLDSEEDDAIFIGCAGGRDTQFTLKNRTARAPKDSAGRKVTVMGLKGGHSGVDIHLQRANAIRLLGRFLSRAGRTSPTVVQSRRSVCSQKNLIPQIAIVQVGRAHFFTFLRYRKY